MELSAVAVEHVAAKRRVKIRALLVAVAAKCNAGFSQRFYGSHRKFSGLFFEGQGS